MTTEKIVKKHKQIPEDNNFGARLKKARILSGKTQQQLAAEVGIKQQAIQRIEAGKVRSSSHLVPLAIALNVSPAWLYEGAENEPIPLQIQERISDYESIFPSLPLLSWHEFMETIDSEKVFTKAHFEIYPKVPSFTPVTSKALAIRLKAEELWSLTCEVNYSFQNNDILIIDSGKTPQAGDLILTSQKSQNRPSIFIVKYDENLVEQKEEMTIHGVLIERLSCFN